MKRSFVVSFAAVLVWSFSFWGCSKAVRYTPEEISGYPPEIQERIKSEEVAIGMTTNQVRYSWGAPTTVNVLQPSEDGKPREEWIYSKMVGVFMERRLLFVDGKLVDIFPATGNTKP